ncbi:MAG: hypothetical protein R3E79_37575 [Caldilineaceae bacterium]
MIYRVLGQVSGLLLGALAMLAFVWAIPGVRAFPAWTTTAASQSVVVHESFAATPLIHYQGRMLDAVSGQPKPDGAYTLSFRLYPVATGGAPLWTETKSVTVSKGLFNTLLGDSTVLDSALFTGQELYLGITIGTDPEAAPRQRLAHVAYAIHAEQASVAGSAGNANNADQLDGQDASAFAAASHSHSGSDITSGTVAEPYLDNALARDNEVLPLVLAGDGSGSGLDADTLDGLDQASFYKGSTGVQVNQTTPLAAGGQEYWFTFGYSADQLVVWRVKPTVVGAKMRVEVETEMSTNNTVTYWLRVYNTGTVASGYQLIRHHFTQ